MVRTSSIAMPSMVRIVGRVPAVNEKVLFFVYHALELQSL